MKLGSLNNIMGMIPGLSNQVLNKNTEKENFARIKDSLCVLG